MAMIGLQVPVSTTRLLSGIDFGDVGAKEDTGLFHVTTHYLGDDLSIKELAEAIAPLFQAAAQIPPFSASVSHVTTFPPHPDKGTVPVVGLVDSPELHRLKSGIDAALDRAGIEYSKKFPVYKPHVTLGMSKDPLVHADNAVDIHLQAPVTWGVGEIMLWGGSKGDQQVVISVPLTVKATKTAAARVPFEHLLMRAAVRLSMRAGRPGWPRHY